MAWYLPLWVSWCGGDWRPGEYERLMTSLREISRRGTPVRSGKKGRLILGECIHVLVPDGRAQEVHTIHVVEDCEEGAQGGATAGLVAAEITKDGAVG